MFLLAFDFLCVAVCFRTEETGERSSDGEGLWGNRVILEYGYPKCAGKEKGVLSCQWTGV